MMGMAEFDISTECLLEHWTAFCWMEYAVLASYEACCCASMSREMETSSILFAATTEFFGEESTQDRVDIRIRTQKDEFLWQANRLHECWATTAPARGRLAAALSDQAHVSYGFTYTYIQGARIVQLVMSHVPSLTKTAGRMLS